MTTIEIKTVLFALRELKSNLDWDQQKVFETWTGSKLTPMNIQKIHDDLVKDSQKQITTEKIQELKDEIKLETFKLMRSDVDGYPSVTAEYNGKPTVAQLTNDLEECYEPPQALQLAEELVANDEVYVGDMENTHFHLL